MQRIELQIVICKKKQLAISLGREGEKRVFSPSDTPHMYKLIAHVSLP